MLALKKIMLVDNEIDIREAACLCLKDMGSFDIIACESGREALDRFTATQPQMILLDVMMPGMNGLATFEGLKQLPGGKDVPVIFMTARAHDVNIREYMGKGAAGVIAKPFDPITVVKEITSIWQQYCERKAVI